MAGKFIVIEGIDGSGKTTLVHGLTKKLKEDGLRVWSTFEPTKNVIGSMIRSRLAEKAANKDSIQQWAEFELLLAADRMNHLHTEILPVLESHDVVLCDRYIGSGFAYGMTCRPRSISYEEAYHFLSTIYRYARLPDHTIYVDVSVDVAMKRAQARGDLSRYEDTEFLTATASEYRWMVGKFNWTPIEADNMGPEVLLSEVAAFVHRHVPSA